MGEDGKIIYKVVINDDGAAEQGEAAGRRAGDAVERGARTGTSAFGEMMTGAFRRIGAAAVEMAGKAANAAVNVTKAALDSVASYEQNIGGVETLFGDSAETVIANAKRAYETAGMSANAYMQNVTSFSASLLQSLGGDTAKAADYADRAIISMSDNANKMGTDIHSIQNAYQGFAKQNYTMLDNLKLGYGGTKEEMERLVAEAANMTAAQEKLGVTVDGTSLSFANIVNAIAVVQEEMGIAGATADESAKTIEGSMNAAKAAYDNFLNGSISAEDFAATVGTAAKNIVNNLAEIVTRFSTEIPGLVEALGEMLPGLVETIGPPLFSAVTALLGSLLQLFLENLPQMVDMGITLLLGLVDGLIAALPELIPAIVQIITQIQTSLIEHLPELIEAGLQLIVALGVGLVRAIPDLLAMTPQIISSLINAFTSADWSSIGSNIVSGIWNGITGLWGDLTSKVSGAVTNLWNSAKGALGISSPSKKFKYIGEMSVEGTMEGFEENEAEMTRVVRDVYSGIGDTAEATLQPEMSGSIAQDVERNVSVNMTATGTTDGTYIVVPVNLDGREIARATAWKMGEQMAWEELG